MKSRLVNESKGQRTFVIVLDPGEEAFETLTAFAREHGVDGASLTAIGAFERAVVGWFDFDAKTYRKIPVDEPSLHIHAVLGLSDGSTKGGHFLEGIVRPTLEITLVEAPGHLRRRKRRPEIGAALIDLDA